ncbi:unnamed protein product [Paramecium pentaurelia]|uniref:Uncharacterized protein n=1 Tax=Paramecium pentaurelia TaxID=43138 RepID=A0A8S1YJ78_9CILI|nr:unnamed protein product [Paramecium pentaurelia]
MFTKFKDNLRKIDIFGQSITLSFRQEEQYRTSLGGMLSLCIIATIISFFYSNIIDFFQKNTVSSESEQQFNEDPSTIQLLPNNFMFAVQIDQVNFTTNPYFNITVEQRGYIRDENGTQVKLPPLYVDLVPCTLEHFKPIFDQYNTSFEDQFKQYNLNNFLCPNLNHPLTSNMTVGGAWTSREFSFLKFVVSSCKSNSGNNFSWKPQCKTEEEMQKYLKSYGSFRFQVYTTNYLINPESPKHFIQPYISIEQFYSFVPNAMFVQSDIFLRPRKVTTDDGILMYPQQTTQTYITRDYMDNREQSAISGLTPGYYGAFYFVRSPYSYDIKRNFMRLDELLSNLGGFSQFMIAVIGVLIKFYNREHMVIEMANDLYEFDLNKKRNNTIEAHNALLASTQRGREALKRSMHKIKGDSAIQIKSMSTFHQKPIMGQFLSPQNIDRQESIKLKDGINSHRSSKLKRVSQLKVQCSAIFEQFKQLMITSQHIGISLKLILSQIIPFQCIQTDECIVLQKAIAQVNKELDIQYIIKQLHEMIKLKRVLFNPEQITLFNFSHRPTISLIRDKRNRKSTVLKQILDNPTHEIVLSQLFTDLVNSYQKLIGLDDQVMSEEQIRFNQRLISLLGQKLPHLLEKELAQASEEESNDEEPKPEDIISRSS